MSGGSRLGWMALLVVVGMQTLAIGVIVALLADIQDRFGYPTWALGVITGAAFLAALVGHLTMSPIADRGHERAMVLFGGLLTVTALVTMALATELWHWVAARSFLGLAEGAFIPAARRIVVGWKPEVPGRALARLYTATLSGFVIGPPVGAFLAEGFGPDAPFVVPAVVIAVSLLFLIRVDVVDVPPPATRSHRRELLRHPVIAAGVVLGASQWLLIGLLDSVWARYVTDLGGSITTIGLSFLALVVPTVLLTPTSGAVADRHTPVRVAMVALAIEAPLVGALGLAPGLAVLIVVAIAQALVFPFVATSAQVAIASVSPPGQVAEAQGLAEAAGLVAAGIGALAAPAVYDAMGVRFLMASAMLVLLLMSAGVWAGRSRWRTAAPLSGETVA